MVIWVQCSTSPCFLQKSGRSFFLRNIFCPFGWFGIQNIEPLHFLPDHFPIVALLAIHDFFSLRRIRRNHFFLALVAFPLEEFSRIPERHAVKVSLIGVAFWNRQMVLSVEIQLLFDDPKGLLRHFALDRPVEDVIGDLRNVIRKLVRRDDLFHFRKRSFVV